MMQSETASPKGAWSVPQSPITVEYSRRVLDDIRLAVMDAFFSLPRGGAEIGGVLLGRHAEGSVSIEGYAPLECEHATGPSFTLSVRDHARLEELLASLRHASDGRQPVGWYHSHTRSEIFLSEADRAIHNRYFKEPWQVALVLKPHTFQPTRAGFFFREPNGEIHAEASYAEFALEPMPAHRVPEAPAGRNETAPPPARRRAAEPQPPAVPAVPVAAAPPPEPPPPPPPPRVEIPPESLPRAVPPEPAAGSEPLPAPAFTQLTPHRSWRWLNVVWAIGGGIALGAGAYQTRDLWLRTAIAWVRPSPSEAGHRVAASGGSLGLRALDTNGQLWIMWDRANPLIGAATAGALVIRDGALTRTVDLDATHLGAGSFTYGRQSEQVDITLSVTEPNGETAREVTTYLGRLPSTHAAPDDSLRKQNDKLTGDLNAERARSKQLQDALTKMKRDQQLKRLEKQDR